jgi:hypothetical protein
MLKWKSVLITIPALSSLFTGTELTFGLEDRSVRSAGSQHRRTSTVLARALSRVKALLNAAQYCHEGVNAQRDDYCAGNFRSP